ncbi:MAG TPA: hypothetical protein VET65_12425 [Candidatus Limnocylindrales bacterium]|nr:hypothetical protein [Candidatus Limnocylindrales bacterium]
MSTSRTGAGRRVVRWGWPLLLLAAAWLWAPLRARADYPGMSCTSGVSTAFMWASYTVLFVPVAIALLLVARWIRRALTRGRRLLAFALGVSGAVLAVAYLVFAGLTVPRNETAIACPALGGSLQAVHCWRSGTTIEVNAVGRRPQDASALQAMAQTLAAHKQDAVLDEAFVYDTQDEAVVGYSNARLFLLQRPDLTAFGDLCLSDRQSHAREVISHRIGFYRYSLQQAPPVDAFFLQDSAPGGQRGYEVIDFRHGGEALPYVRPADLQPAETAYLDRVVAGTTRLNADLDREQQSHAPAGALSAMRRDFDRITADLATGTPPRLILYRDSRLKRFLENYDLILVAEESAAQGQSAQKIHSTAYEQHRQYYFQEPQVTPLIGYLYLQEPGRTFSDDELSTVNWAIF